MKRGAIRCEDGQRQPWFDVLYLCSEFGRKAGSLVGKQQDEIDLFRLDHLERKSGIGDFANVRKC